MNGSPSFRPGRESFPFMTLHKAQKYLYFFYCSFNIKVIVVFLFLVPPGKQQVRPKVNYGGGVHPQGRFYLCSYLTYVCMGSTPLRNDNTLIFRNAL